MYNIKIQSSCALHLGMSLLNQMCRKLTLQHYTFHIPALHFEINAALSNVDTKYNF